jgi:hypothetical protein
MMLDKLPPELRPIVQVVPDWFRPQRLGLVFEANVGKGKLLVCSIDLEEDLASRPVARQLRHSLLQYVASDNFEPKSNASFGEVRDLFREPTLLQQIGATIKADSVHPNYPATNAMDGDPKTVWHTNWEPTPAPMPHSLILDLGKLHLVKGMRYLPRQDMTNGRIAEFTIHVSDDGQDWGEPVASGTFPPDAGLQIIRFSQAHSARFLRLAANREVNGKPFASAAEIDVILSDGGVP